jgi:hypothetical protein
MLPLPVACCPLPAISPVGSGANFGGLPPGGASSPSLATLAGDSDPASLAASLRLLFSVIAFAICQFLSGAGLYYTTMTRASSIPDRTR